MKRFMMLFKKCVLKKQHIAILLILLAVALAFVSYSYVKEKQKVDFYRIRVMSMMLGNIQNPYNGIHTWDSKDEWTWNTSKIAVYELNYPYDDLGDYGEICSMLNELDRVQWDDPNRIRMAEEIANLKVWYIIQPWEKKIFIQDEE